MVEFSYYLMLSIFFMLGYTMLFQQLFRVSQRRLIKRHWLQRSQLELPAALFTCLVVLILRVFSRQLTGRVYWFLINLHFSVINYTAVMVESSLSLLLISIVAFILLASTGAMFSPWSWLFFVLVILVLYIQHLRIRQFDRHPVLYWILPSVLGPAIWIPIYLAAGHAWLMTPWTIFSLCFNYVANMLLAFWYTRQLHLERQLNSKFAQAARYDDLTGFQNWSAFRNDFESAFRRVSVTAPLTVATIDIDWFKQLNDQYGRSTGNQVLVTLTQNLNDALSVSGLDYRCYRTGGEELTVLLSNTTLSQATPVLETWHHAIRELTIVANDVPIKLTVSLGLTQVRPEDRNATTTFQRADWNLYESKHAGRDKLTAI